MAGFGDLPHRFVGVVNFLEADCLVKSELVERLAHSWDLAPAVFFDLQRVAEDHIAIAEVKPCIF